MDSKEPSRFGFHFAASLRVSGRPFRAHVQQITTEVDLSEETVVGAIYRASDGSVRIEQTQPGAAMRLAEIYNCSNRIVYLLDLTQQLTLAAIREDEFFDPALRGSNVSADGWSFSANNRLYTDEYRVIEGLRCRRVQAASAELEDSWWSEDLRLMIVGHHVEKGRKFTVMLSNIERYEPSAELFVPR